MTVHLPLSNDGASALSRDVRPVVLVADDEVPLRRSLLLMLGGAGFAAVEAHDGLEAVEIVRGRDDIAVALLDVSMPRMGGLEAARAIRGIRSDLPIVMMSGYDQDPLVGVELIAKPFEPEVLLALLARMTGARASEPR